MSFSREHNLELAKYLPSFSIKTSILSRWSDKIKIPPLKVWLKVFMFLIFAHEHDRRVIFISPGLHSDVHLIWGAPTSGPLPSISMVFPELRLGSHSYKAFDDFSGKKFSFLQCFEGRHRAHKVPLFHKPCIREQKEISTNQVVGCVAIPCPGGVHNANIIQAALKGSSPGVFWIPFQVVLCTEHLKIMQTVRVDIYFQRAGSYFKLCKNSMKAIKNASLEIDYLFKCHITQGHFMARAFLNKVL